MAIKQGYIAVYGASGHTGKFVIDELRRRNMPVIAAGRDPSRFYGDLPFRTARINDPASLDLAFSDCAVIINCAGPFLDTAVPIVEAALRIGSCYIDVTAEQASAQALFDTYDERARAAGITIIPAAGFYGGLADLLATALVGGERVDEMTTAIALSHWWPTQGTRLTGESNNVPRVVVEKGKIVPMHLPAREISWFFDAPFGEQPMVELSFSEIVTISRHLPIQALHSYLNTAPLAELRDASTPPPTAIDPNGRSAQLFAMEVVAANADGRRRAKASGQDIYAVSAPLAAEAAARLLQPSFDRRGALSLGQAFNAHEFLLSLAPAHLTVEFVSLSTGQFF